MLEKWITPSLFKGLQTTDEYSFCVETAATKHASLKHHRDTFIPKLDFEWLAQNKINAVRIPVGYWALEKDDPYINCVVQLDQAFRWAAELGMKVIIDLHGAPGSQNGQDHSGKTGSIEWSRSSNVERTIEVIGQLSERYRSQQALWGIELLNEPGWDVPLSLLRDYYTKAYAVVRAHCDEKVAVIISDGFRPLKWNNFMGEPKYKNVILDLHLYQCFTPKDNALDIDGHIEKVYGEWARVLTKIDKPAMIGEWSLGLHPKTFVGMDKDQQNAALKSYANAQLDVFSKAAGSFFWTYKTEDHPGWNYKDCINKSLIT